MIQWFTRNGVAANLLMAVILVGGFLSFKSIKMEMFPEMDLDIISIYVPYPGATPEESEQSICIRIEEEIFDLEGIKRITSNGVEGSGVVTVEVERGYDARILLDEVKVRVDSITTFPVDAEKPIVELPTLKSDVVHLSLYGDLTERELKVMGERMRDDLTAIPGITQVAIFGPRDYEIGIEVSEHQLRRYDLTFDDVSEAIRRTSLDLPAGLIRAESGEVLLRTKGQAYTGDDFSDVVILTRPDGTQVKVGDVAQVNDGFKDEPSGMFFNGKPAVSLKVFEVGDQNTLDIAEKVHKYYEQKKFELPDGVELELWGDWSFYLKARLNMLFENGIIGLVLVFCLLTLFLRPTLAIWVTLGIPIAFLGAFILLPFLGVSVNIISLFGLIMVLGIVVDDAIVVGESVFSEYQRSGHSVESTIRGAHAVAMPVTFAVLTTAVAFVPILLIPGTQGKFLNHIPYVVIATLAFSLIESKLILPYHLTIFKVGNQDRDKLNVLMRTQRRIADGLEWYVEHIFKPSLELALRYRYVTVMIFVAMLTCIILLVKYNHVMLQIFPSPPSDYISMRITMVDGSTEKQTKAAVDRALEQLQYRVDAYAEQGYPGTIENYTYSIGSQPFSRGPNGSDTSTTGASFAEIFVEMKKAEDREIGADVFADVWREELGPIPGAKQVVMTARAASGGVALDLELSGNDIDVMRQAADELKEQLGTYEGLFDIRDNFSGGKRELQFELKPEAELLGISQASLGRQIRQAFYGEEVQRVQRGRDDVRVLVRYTEEERRNLETLENMRVRTVDGQQVPLRDVAEVFWGRSNSTITRVDRSRVINVQADANKLTANLEVIKAELDETVMPELMQKYPGLRWGYQGEAREGNEALASLMNSTYMVMLVIYVLMAIPFKSYFQPLIIMMVIPFGLIGAIGGHILQGLPISMLSMLGMLAMAGVLVNDSLVLVDYINKRVKSGKETLFEAVRSAGARRFRPILLTSLTTFVGLAPILLEKSLQAQFLIPMATSMAFGVLFGTFVTLLIVPCAYMILEDIKIALWYIFNPMAKFLFDVELKHPKSMQPPPIPQE